MSSKVNPHRGQFQNVLKVVVTYCYQRVYVATAPAFSPQPTGLVSERIPYLRGYDASVDQVLGPDHGCRLASETPIMMIGRMIAVSIAIVMKVLIMFVSLCSLLLCMLPLYLYYRHNASPNVSYSRILSK